MDLLNAPEILVPVRCPVDSGMCLLRKLSTFFPLLSSSPAFENIWACWRKRKITNFVQSEYSLSGSRAARKAYSLPVLQLNCLSVQQGIFPAIDKMAKALAACQILFCDPKLLSLFRQSVIYLTVVALRILFIMLLQIIFSEWLWFASALVFELKAESFFSPFS